MAATFTNVSLLSPGATTRGHRVVMCTLTRGAADYPTGGDVITPATFGLRFIKKIYCNLLTITGAAGALYGTTYDVTASKIKTHVGATGVEAAAGLAALNGLNFDLLVIGS
jgi:hypothetical protein